MKFARAFLPRCCFELPPITEVEPCAGFGPAKGPDGWAKDDLLNMPAPRMREL